MFIISNINNTNDDVYILLENCLFFNIFGSDLAEELKKLLLDINLINISIIKPNLFVSLTKLYYCAHEMSIIDVTSGLKICENYYNVASSSLLLNKLSYNDYFILFEYVFKLMIRIKYFILLDDYFFVNELIKKFNTSNNNNGNDIINNSF